MSPRSPRSGTLRPANRQRGAGAGDARPRPAWSIAPRPPCKGMQRVAGSCARPLPPPWAQPLRGQVEGRCLTPGWGICSPGEHKAFFSPAASPARRLVVLFLVIYVPSFTHFPYFFSWRRFSLGSVSLTPFRCFFLSFPSHFSSCLLRKTAPGRASCSPRPACCAPREKAAVERGVREARLTARPVGVRGLRGAWFCLGVLLLFFLLLLLLSSGAETGQGH